MFPLPQPDIGYWNLLELNNSAAGYPIAPLPNGTHIALEVISLQGPNPLNAVFVLSSNGKIKKTSDDYVAHNPIWTSNDEIGLFSSEFHRDT
ncbi:hypothetical protein MTYM_01410 [Methylococcales bacterium]|nr:hypothetical protein MTYM_01410 [Methylococcales bacterium]